MKAKTVCGSTFFGWCSHKQPPISVIGTSAIQTLYISVSVKVVDSMYKIDDLLKVLLCETIYKTIIMIDLQ